MRLGFYRRLAWTGIRQNKKMYLPYILACIGVVMVCYIVSFLGLSPVLKEMPGGGSAQSFLNTGFGVMCVFSTIFLFYTNSFLIRRRKKEFGLYNILGMGKRHLALVLLWETVIIAAITLVVGLFCGVLFSKVVELALTRILDGGVTYTMTVELNSVVSTVVLFLVIFALMFLNTLRQIHLPIDDLHPARVADLLRQALVQILRPYGKLRQSGILLLLPLPAARLGRTPARLLLPRGLVSFLLRLQRRRR